MGLNQEGDRRVNKDWAGWAQVLVPVLLAVGGVYAAMSAKLAVTQATLEQIVQQQHTIMALVQPLDKQVAINTLRIDNIEKELEGN